VFKPCEGLHILWMSIEMFLCEGARAGRLHSAVFS
jgi:hypothetical protein